MNRKENWRTIMGFDGYYEISDMGNVRSVDRLVKFRHGMRLRKGCPIKPLHSWNGYLSVQLRKEIKKTCYTIHRLVLIHFSERIDGLDIVNHKDGVKTNNQIENLEWTNKAGNLLHAISIGRLHNVHGKFTKA